MAEIRALLRRRSVSAIELARWTLEQLDARGRELRAVAELVEPLALRDARRADRVLNRGEGGPLTGIPYGAKDLLDTAGFPTRWGAPPYRDRIPTRDATVINRMRKAGAVLVAKLSLIELAGGGGYSSAAASIDGACVNPWDRSRWTGGSSSGSAAAVAAGLLPITLGSDTGGSLIFPAAYCGVTTLRPSFGAVSRYGAMPLAWSMDKIGPLSRNVADCEAVVATIAGYDTNDWTTQSWTYRANRRTSFRLGIIYEGAPRNTTTEAVFQTALVELRAVGMLTRKVTLPVFDYQGVHNAIIGTEAALAHHELINGRGLGLLLDDTQRAGLRRGASVSALDYARAIEERGRITRAIRVLFRRYDALIAPTVWIEATRLDENQLDSRQQRGGLAWLGSLVGLPAVSVPMGFGPAGLPLGLSIIGDRFGEATILRIALFYQRATGWHLARPPTA